MPRLLPDPRVLSLAEVYRLLGRQVTDDALEHAWLKHCCLKDVPCGSPRRFFALSDVQAVEERLLTGQYPGQPPR